MALQAGRTGWQPVVAEGSKAGAQGGSGVSACVQARYTVVWLGQKQLAAQARRPAADEVDARGWRHPQAARGPLAVLV